MIVSAVSRFENGAVADQHKFLVLVQKLDGLLVQLRQLVAAKVQVLQLLHVPDHDVYRFQGSGVDLVVGQFQSLQGSALADAEAQPAEQFRCYAAAVQ